MIGVGLVSFITIFASSTTASINATIDRSFTGDFVVDAGVGNGPGTVGGLDPSLAAQLNQLPEVSAAAGIRVGAAKIDGSVEQVLGLDPATAFRLFNIKPLQGKTTDLGAGAIAVYKNVAHDKRLRIGSLLPVIFKDTGLQQLRVALIYGENRPGGNYLMGLPAYNANFANHYDAQVFVKKAPGVSKATALAAVKGVASKYPGAKVLDQTGYKNELTKPVKMLLSLIYVLLALGHHHRAHRHRQHARPVDLRTHPRTRTATGGRHDQGPAPIHHQVGIGPHRAPGNRPRPTRRYLLRMVARTRPEQQGA